MNDLGRRAGGAGGDDQAGKRGEARARATRESDGDARERLRRNENRTMMSGRGRANARAREREGVALTRGLMLNKLVVTRTSGARLGAATQLWVDTDAWEVVALDVRQNAFVGVVDHVLLESLRQVGDVILVHDEDAVERRWSSYGYSTVVGKDVVTESGQFIGRVRDFEFDPEDGAIGRLIVDAWGVPTVPEGVISTYAVDVSEIIQCGQERVVVAEDAESRVEQLSVSVLQRLTLTSPPWEEETYADADEYYYDRAPYASEYDRQFARDEYAAYFDRRRERAGAPPPPLAMNERRRSGPSESRGIPLMRPSEPYERRDVDGGYGEPSRRSFSDWVVREQRRDDMYEMADAFYEEPPRRASAARVPLRVEPRAPSQSRAPRQSRAPPRAPPRPAPSPPPAAFDASEDML